MNPHPHRDRQRLLGFAGGLEGSRRRGKRDEEPIPLRVNLDAAVPPERLPQDASMLREHRRVSIRTELVQEPRRALDVGEEEGDSSVGQRTHGRIMLRGYDARPSGEAHE